MHSRLDPQTITHIKKVHELQAQSQNNTDDIIDAIRREAKQRYLLTGYSVNTPVLKEEARSIDGPNGSVPIRIYWPREQKTNEKLPIFIYIHGGGWVLADMDDYEKPIKSVATKADCIAINVDYRLAPEHPFPAGLDDCYTVLEWVSENADKLGGDPKRIAVGGDSAGGNLTAAMTLRSRDNKGPEIAAQVLLYPSVALGKESDYPSMELYGCNNDFLLSKENVNIVSELYLGGAKDKLSDPLVSPITAESHEDLPAALIITAEFDVLRDEGKHYAEKLEKSGTPVEYCCFQGVVHGFFADDIDKSTDSHKHVADYLKKRLHPR